MTLALSILVYCGVGCIEWLLAVVRTVACARRQSNRVALIVFCETVLGLAVLRYLVLGDSWWCVGAYAMGAAIGSWAGTRKGKG